MQEKFLKLDWLSFTFIPSSNGEDGTPFEQFLKEFPFIDKSLFVCPSFRTCYTDTFLYCDLVVSFNSFDDSLSNTEFNRLWNMGVNVQVPSHCLKFFFDMCGLRFGYTYDVWTIFSFLKEHHCQPSRIDLCYDDFSKCLTADYYRRKWVDGCIQSPFIRSVTCMGSDEGGYTMYFGSLKKRDKLLRIYDKFLESGGEYDCVRYEFELHSAKARALADAIINEYREGIPFFEFLAGWIVVKDASSVANCARIQDAKIDSEWTEALSLNLTLKYVIKIPSEKRPQQSLTHFVEKQAIGSIAGYVKCYGKGALLKLIRDAIDHDRISPRYKSFYNKLMSADELWIDDNEDCPFL